MLEWTNLGPYGPIVTEIISQLPDVAKQIEGFAENKEQLVKLKKIDEGMKEATDIRKKYSDEIVQAWIQPIEEERFYNTLTSMSVIASGTTAYTSMKPELPPGWQIKKAVDTDICPRCGSHLYRYMYDMACRNCRWPWR